MTESAKTVPTEIPGVEPMDQDVISSVTMINLTPPPPPPTDEPKSADPPPGDSSPAAEPAKAPADLVAALTDVVVVSTTVNRSTVVL